MWQKTPMLEIDHLIVFFEDVVSAIYRSNLAVRPKETQWIL